MLHGYRENVRKSGCSRSIPFDGVRYREDASRRISSRPSRGRRPRAPLNEGAQPEWRRGKAVLFPIRFCMSTMVSLPQSRSYSGAGLIQSAISQSNPLAFCRSSALATMGGFPHPPPGCAPHGRPSALSALRDRARSGPHRRGRKRAMLSIQGSTGSDITRRAAPRKPDLACARAEAPAAEHEMSTGSHLFAPSMSRTRSPPFHVAQLPHVEVCTVLFNPTPQL